jgi:hypothetical protein
MKKTKNVSRITAFRLRQPETEALYSLARHYGLSKSDVVRWLLIREAAKIQHNNEEKGNGQRNS